MIDETAWDLFGNGTVTIRFYANDTVGNINWAEVTMRKDIDAPTEIEYIQNIIYVDESEGDTIVSEDNLPAVIFIIGAICAPALMLALIIIALIKKNTSLEKHIKLAGTDLKSKKIDKMKNVR